MDIDLELNAASGIKEVLHLSDKGAIAVARIIKHQTNANQLLALVVKIAKASEKDWPYTKPQQEMTAQARELLREMGIDWKE